tara:strand:+ start:256 stop:1053 length:798 start_codon:yes stop_codon:yes gene_type:complete
MHYYQFNIGDYASHTSRLTLLEDLAYRRMLDLYYLNEQPLNGCSTDIARELGMSEHVNEVKYVLGKFFTETELGFSQKRIDLEIKKYKSNAKNKSKAGKASAKARATKAHSKETGVEQVLNATSTGEQLNIKHKPLTTNQEPRTNKPLSNMSAKDNLSFELFKYWCEVMGKSISTSKLTSNRDKAIKARLKEGYTVEQIKEAIDGCRKDPFSMGQNDRQKPFNDIQLICRNGEKIESFLTGHVAKQGDINSISTNFDAPEGWNNE